MLCFPVIHEGALVPLLQYITSNIEVVCLMALQCVCLMCEIEAAADVIVNCQDKHYLAKILGLTRHKDEQVQLKKNFIKQQNWLHPLEHKIIHVVVWMTLFWRKCRIKKIFKKFMELDFLGSGCRTWKIHQASGIPVVRVAGLRVRNLI